MFRVPKYLAMPLAALAILLGLALTARGADKLPVAVRHTGTDQVGQSLAFEVKELIRKSASFRLALPEQLPYLRVAFVSISEQAEGAQNISSAIGWSIAYDNAHLPGQGIMLILGAKSCGMKAVPACASQILPAIDIAAENLRTDAPEMYKQLQ